MADPVELNQSGSIAKLFSFLDEFFGLRNRDDLVVRAMYQDMFRSTGKELLGTASVVPVCVLVWRSAHEFCNRAVSQPLLPGGSKVAYASERNCVDKTVLLSASQRRGFGYAVSAGQP